MVVRSLDNVVIKSPTDRRSYRILHLPNGLTAVLVHDPDIFPDVALPAEYEADTRTRALDSEDDNMEDDDDDEEVDSCDEEDEEEEDEAGAGGKSEGRTKKAAAAMCVAMGSFSDPYKAQGLAHFLEHMLFMGSSEFPDENEYDSYLSQHGGSSNAYTEAEYTCYHFEVNHEYLKGALERFSQFFISPLVKAEAMEREVLAVDSEFNQVLQNDSYRLLQLTCHTSTPGHPFNRFFWGNKKSLVDAMENGVNLREEILLMYRENYLGDIMKLVVIGGESLDILEKWVVELFSKVKKGNPVRAITGCDIPIWKPGKLYRLEAVKDVHVLELSWRLPCLHKEYLKKPEDYLAHLLGHEGSGSLLFFFKAKGWATSLSAGVGDEGMRRSSIAYVFVMSINLTYSGVERIFDIIGFVYQYIKMLYQSAPPEWVFKELQDIGNMEFRFVDEQPQDDYAAELAENLLFYSEEHIIYGEYAFKQWDPKLIEFVLSYFSPKNMRIDLLSKSFNKDSQGILCEPWFGTSYVEEDILSSILELWGDSPHIDPSLHLPLKNEFIPKDFLIRNANVLQNSVNTNYPKCIIDNPLMKLWHKIDLTFNVPRANAYFLITVKDGYSSLRTCVLTELFVSLLKDELNEIIYQAGVAKLDTSLSIIGHKLELRLYGFNDKLSTLLSKILTIARNFSPKIDRFKVIKEDMERSLKNVNMKPLSHSTYLRLQVLREKFWDADEKLACLVKLSLSELEAFIPILLSELHVEGLCHGNLLENEATNISDIFNNTFSMRPLPLGLHNQDRVLCLSSNESLVKSMPVKNEVEVNSVVELYFQIEQDKGSKATQLTAITDLFGNIVHEPCYNQLRTKEQLGYVVECGPRMTYRVLGFCFRVQSSNYNPCYLHQRIDNFVGGLPDILEKLDDESFENHKSGLIANKLEKDPSLLYETERYWTQIVDKRYQFDRPKLEAEELKAISKSDVINWYNTYLVSSSPKCRRLAIHIWGCNSNLKEEGNTQYQFGKVIDDIRSFKLSSEFYPSLC
ncbi:nardilysin-like isoform X1 [Dendrobium catenatum]|uniref:nardilysin-like isoform X1 n=1 Tax=Dendrobium catenatum TaxID=906689 RepID=UPI0009F66DF9|nr:nardilysin-like isoform X1 [Dendrobium catenatum]